MADDNAPKIASIDDLVNELTKKNNGGPAPLAPAPEIPKPRFTPPPPPLAPRPAPAPAPSVPMPPKPPSAPMGAPAMPPAAPVKEYQSSIRTMKEDISTLKQGQKPAGVQVPRKIEPPPIPVSPQVKPPTPPQQFKVPSVNLGQSEKTSPLPNPPSAPQKPQIYVPPAPSSSISGGDSNRLFLLIAGVAVVFGILYWFLILRQPVPEIAEETPTPTATPIPTLSDLFPGTEVPILIEGDDLIKSFNAVFGNLAIEVGKFNELAPASQGGPLSWLNFVTLPQQLINALGSDLLLLGYGQKEIFDSKGQLILTAPTEKRLALIAEVRDQISMLQDMSAWETTIAGDLQELFVLTITKQPNPSFLDNTYQGTAIRYKNFPYADRSIDLAVVSATNGKSYLVITNSKESMYSAIDVLKGFIGQ